MKLYMFCRVFSAKKDGSKRIRKGEYCTEVKVTHFLTISKILIAEVTAVVYKPKWPIDVINLCKPHYEISRTTSEITLLVENFRNGLENAANFLSNFRAKFRRKFAGTKNEIRAFRSHYVCTIL